MQKSFIVFILIAVCAFTVLANDDKKSAKPDQPNLTGTWLLDRKKSNVDASSRPNLPIKITHQNPEVKITRSSDRSGHVVETETVYYTDGRGETNPASMMLSTAQEINSKKLDNEVVRSKTRWSGKKLVTRSVLKNIVAGHILEFELVDEWKLSDDDQTLTLTSRTIFRSASQNTIFVPAVEPEHKSVYHRVKI